MCYRPGTRAVCLRPGTTVVCLPPAFPSRSRVKWFIAQKQVSVESAFFGRIPVPVFLATSVPNTRQGIWKMMSHVFDLFIRWEIKCLLVMYLMEN